MSRSTQLAECMLWHRPVGTFGWPVPLTQEWSGPHASIVVCDREGCRHAANRWVRRHTGRDGIFRSFVQARAERQQAGAGAAR